MSTSSQTRLLMMVNQWQRSLHSADVLVTEPGTLASLSSKNFLIALVAAQPALTSSNSINSINITAFDPGEVA